MYKQIKNILLKTDRICTVFFWIFGTMPILMFAYMYRFNGGMNISLAVFFICSNSGLLYMITFMLKRTRGKLRIVYNCGGSKIEIIRNIALVLLAQYIKMIVIGILFYVGIF